MKKTPIANAVLPLFLLAILIFPAPVLAALTVESTINQDLYVTIDFTGIDSTTYAKIEANTQFNETTIPQTIMQSLTQKDLKRVGWGYALIDKNPTESSVHVAFHIGGSDIISFTIDKTSMERTYRVSTDWRNFRVDLADGFSVDFAQYFGTPVYEWLETSRTDAQGLHQAYYYESSGQDSFQASFYFVLAANAKNIQRVGDTITYEVPPYTEDVLLNSPLLVLGVVMAISIIVVVYRKTRA